MSTTLRDTLRDIRKEHQEKYYTHRNMHVTQRDQHTISLEEENMFLRKENESLLSRLAHMQDMLRLFAQHSYCLPRTKRTRHSVYYDHLYEPLHF